jgi:hypothetical protein
MKSFTEYLQEEPTKADHKAMKDHVYHNVLNTNKTHDAIKKDFVKKFGSHNVKHFEKHVSDIVD